MWFSGEDRLRKGPKEMEEQKQAERQWNKIRRERINILKEAPSEASSADRSQHLIQKN